MKNFKSVLEQDRLLIADYVLIYFTSAIIEASLRLIRYPMVSEGRKRPGWAHSEAGSGTKGLRLVPGGRLVAE
ncbi:hypothetical protein BJX96DRAFT_16336 [Aspergillus floccosus]